MSAILKALAKVDFEDLMNDSRVIAVAEEIQTSVAKKSRARDTRTPEQVIEDSMKGIALEYAVYEKLLALETVYGFKVTLAETKDHDIVIKRNGKCVMIDVKGQFERSGGQWITQTPWEAMNAVDDTIYLVFDARTSTVAKFLGWCYGFNFTPSKYAGSGPYIGVHKLINDDTFF